MNQATDEQLMLTIQAGDNRACGELYQRYKKILYAYFYNNTHSITKSQDLVQITFEKLLKYQQNYKGQGSFKSWLFSIGRNAFVDDYRKKERTAADSLDVRRHNPGHDDSGENILLSKERYEVLHSALNQLAPEQKELLVMTKIDGMKYKEVAEAQGLTVANLKVKIFRTMKELKEIMNKSTLNDI